MQGLSVSLGLPMFLAASIMTTAAGTALHSERFELHLARVGPDTRAATLGIMQSAGALARASGPLSVGLLTTGRPAGAVLTSPRVAIALLLLAIPRLPRLPVTGQRMPQQIALGSRIRYLGYGRMKGTILVRRWPVSSLWRRAAPTARR